MGKHAAEDNRDGLPVFIHSELDDFGLSPFEFRAYAHLARRVNDKGGTYYEGLDEGAKVCRMNVKTYRSALSTLVDRGLVSREDRRGQTSVYRLEPRDKWRPLPNQAGVPNQVGVPETVGGPTKSGRGPLPNQVPKGTPTKELPLRETTSTREKPKRTKKQEHEFNPAEVAQTLPENFDRELFQDFCARRLEKGEPMTLLALKQFITKHKHHPPEALDEMFRSAIIAGWKDLYSRDGKTKPSSALNQYTERGL